MSINIQSLIQNAVAHTLQAAQRAEDKQRPISNLNAEAIAEAFTRELMERHAKTDSRDLSFITAIIESDDGFDESLELDEIVRLLKEGFIYGFDSSDSGSYVYEVHTLNRE